MVLKFQVFTSSSVSPCSSTRFLLIINWSHKREGWSSPQGMVMKPIICEDTKHTCLHVKMIQACPGCIPATSNSWRYRCSTWRKGE